MANPNSRPKISDRPTVIFKGPNGEIEVEAKADVGADRTTIDHKIAKKIGAGPIQKVVKVDDSRRCVVPVVVEINGHELAIDASISDRRGPNYTNGEQKRETDALLGNPILELFGIYPGLETDTDNASSKGTD